MVWSMINQLPKQGGGQLPPFRGALTARHPHQSTLATSAATYSRCGEDALGARTAPEDKSCTHHTIARFNHQGNRPPLMGGSDGLMVSSVQPQSHPCPLPELFGASGDNPSGSTPATPASVQRKPSKPIIAENAPQVLVVSL
jgi:hypothetical protein